jgi:hypothetical protein
MTIWKEIEVLGKFYFAGDSNRPNKIGTLTSEVDSRLTRIEESCFAHCSIRSIKCQCKALEELLHQRS